MRSGFWRYQLIMIVLFIFWSNFFVSGGVLNQVTFNFAVFYPLGFLVGYRSNVENLRSAYFSALLFNCTSYVLAVAAGIPMLDWKLIVSDFLSLIFVLEIGRMVGKRANPIQRRDHL